MSLLKTYQEVTYGLSIDQSGGCGIAWSYLSKTIITLLKESPVPQWTPTQSPSPSTHRKYYKPDPTTRALVLKKIWQRTNPAQYFVYVLSVTCYMIYVHFIIVSWTHCIDNFLMRCLWVCTFFRFHVGFWVPSWYSIERETMKTFKRSPTCCGSWSHATFEEYRSRTTLKEYTPKMCVRGLFELYHTVRRTTTPLATIKQTTVVEMVSMNMSVSIALIALFVASILDMLLFVNFTIKDTCK